MNIVINGGGLVGALSAIYMAKHFPGQQVSVFEKRSDIRNATAESGRSINLILTSRGLFALRNVGLEEEALNLCVPVAGRMMHTVDNEHKFQPYGVKPEEVNYSVPRTKLNAMLIDVAEKRYNVKFAFEHSLEEADFESGSLNYTDKDKRAVSVTADVIIGTDGVSSQTRGQMLEQLKKAGATDVAFHAEHLGISYKELTFPKGKDGGYCMDERALHIWPRGVHFLMGLADKESTFTGTLYLPDGTASLDHIPNAGDVPKFEDLDDKAKVEAYVAKYHPDVPSLVPDYAEQLLSRRHGYLATVRTSHWSYKGKACLLGDAAHGVVPFFGQGMNCGFESVVVLDKFMRKNGVADKAGWEKTFDEFVAYHKPSATAIADMAIENFTEMSFKVGEQEFLDRKAVENYIEATFPSLLRSRYYLVTKTLVPYATVRDAGVYVDACIDAVLAKMKELGATEVSAVPAEVITEIVNANLTPFVKEKGIKFEEPLCEYYPAA